MKKMLVRAVALMTVCVFTTASIGFAAGSSIGIGNISVYKSGKLITKLTGQNPVEDGSLLVCDGKCVIKSEGISLIGANQASIAVANEEETFKLFIKKGSVDFVINNNTRKIAFFTPQGAYTVADVIFNASSQSVVKGKIVVDKDGTTEISVTEGRMVFATADGMKTVDANNNLVLAVKVGEAVDPAGYESNLWKWLVAIGAVAVVAGVWAWQADSDDDDDQTTVIFTDPDTGTSTPHTFVPASPSS